MIARIIEESMQTYRVLGWDVTVAHVSARAGKKRFDFARQNWQTASPEAIVGALHRKRKMANALLLKTGTESGVSAIDIDDQERSAFLRPLIPANAPFSITQGGGLHFYLAWSPELHTASYRSHGFDIRNDGGLLVLPPTSVDGGGVYRWVVEPSGPLPQASPRLIAAIQRLHAVAGAATTKKSAGQRTMEQLTPRQRHWWDRYFDQVRRAPIGRRSERDLALLTWGAKCGLRMDSAWAAVCEVGKFAERGRDYFERTWERALRSA